MLNRNVAGILLLIILYNLSRHNPIIEGMDTYDLNALNDHNSNYLTKKFNNLKKQYTENIYKYKINSRIGNIEKQIEDINKTLTTEITDRISNIIKSRAPELGEEDRKKWPSPPGLVEEDIEEKYKRK